MIIALDANILVALFSDIQLVKGLKKFSSEHRVTQTILPTPALCEFLSHDRIERFSFIQKTKRNVTFQSFDEKAAYQTALLAEKFYEDRLPINKQKVKVDLQILGIALANQSKYLLTGDNDFKDYVDKLKL
jgi:predicted nucleic acid-binding protein